ncbi:hypothetical protein M9H77_34798 [Catharanthus roseus]|uniref:Uncharacterized protein n=1 Tax=Catharanthus roseus TaxID=4058 RepID=A0ACB9ZMX3_CATRO|nr:hypothetical protein M9H77_34798 [Catharanthus roseus]
MIKNITRVRVYPDPPLDPGGSGLGPEFYTLKGMGLGPSLTIRVTHPFPQALRATSRASSSLCRITSLVSFSVLCFFNIALDFRYTFVHIKGVEGGAIENPTEQLYNLLGNAHVPYGFYQLAFHNSTS